ncbi:Anthranilate N-benzoyltransferase protein 3 [Triticum urartu]|uniref:Anthranilate N-benzoyltransferase protein 3 n=1 Tax=Triticum urartu TaxID=4572 RepID=M8AZC7_TRIUA|nr:Anthranilate N-benzoyltransferase protein 3 [Triticum urartu]
MGTKVKVVESCMVPPSEETPRKGLWLSPVDLMQHNLKRGHTPTVYLYRSGSESGPDADVDFFDVARLKAAMAKALVAFYPLAGRLGMDGDGRAEIDCAGQGVLFVVARSDLTVDDLRNFQPSPELRRLFVPRVEDHSPPLMCGIQVGDIVDSEELASVAGRIKGVIRRMDDELVRSWMDWLEMIGTETALPPGSMPETDLRVTSWLGMPMYDADFGWGKPLVMHRAVQPRAGFAYLMNGVGGSVRILMSTEPGIVDDFQRLLYANLI